MPYTAPPPIHLRELEDRLRSSPGLSQKAGIKAAYESIGDSVRLPHVFGSPMVRLGDDCAALQTADGWLLFAIEGLIEGFVNDAPWFAGYSAVMVNLSDISAMGGRPMAVTDALWPGSEAKAKEVWAGMLAWTHCPWQSADESRCIGSRPSESTPDYLRCQAGRPIASGR